MSLLITQGMGDSGTPAPPPPPPATTTRIQMARAVDARTLAVIFSAAVVASDALTPANYIISPTLAVSAVTKVTDLEYWLTTSKQTELATYSVSVQNIHDQNGNLVA